MLEYSRFSASLLGNFLAGRLREDLRGCCRKKITLVLHNSEGRKAGALQAQRYSATVEKATEEELNNLAFDILAADETRYHRTFIEYYLPGMKYGAGAWATTHFKVSK